MIKPPFNTFVIYFLLELPYYLVVEARVLAKKPGNNQSGQEVKYIVEVLKDYKVCFVEKFRNSRLMFKKLLQQL